MRKLSEARRKLAVQAGAVAAMSGCGPMLLRGHHWLGLVWTLCVVAAEAWLVVQMVRVRRREGCA